jgi:purine nucleosidase
MTTFPTVSDDRRLEMLTPPPDKVRVLIDTDAANEVDDQFAITWALLSLDRLDVEAIVAEPFSW